MIDTIRVRLEGRDWKEVPSGWKGSFSKKHICDMVSSEGNQDSTNAMFEHEESGLRVGGTLELPKWAEVSLPRLVYGTNGKLLREEDSKASMGALRDLVSTVVRDPVLLDASRLDLVGQFSGDLRQWNSALRRVPHKQVRRPGLEFFDSGLVWPGKYLHVRLYDKGLEQTRKPSSVVRLEFQTRSSLIPSSVCSAGLLDYAAAYQAYRKLCMGFAPRMVPKIQGLVDLLSWCEKCRFSNDGMTPTELYLAGLSLRHQRRIRAAVADAKLRYFRINWDELVPPSGNPPFVDFEEVA
jgi:hypothetical protein